MLVVGFALGAIAFAFSPPQVRRLSAPPRTTSAPPQDALESHTTQRATPRVHAPDP